MFNIYKKYLIIFTGFVAVVISPVFNIYAQNLSQAKAITQYKEENKKFKQRIGISSQYKNKQKSQTVSKKHKLSNSSKKKKSPSNQYFFKIKNIKSHGNKKLSDSEVADITNRYIGKEFTPKIEEALLTDISEKYNEMGYIYSFASDLTTKNGTINITILEGHIRDIIYDKQFDNDPLFQYCIKKLINIKPYNHNEGKFYFGLIKKSPALIGKLNIAPQIVHPLKNIKKDDPAVVDLYIRNYYYGYSGLLSINNRYRDPKGKNITSSGNNNPEIQYKSSNFATGLFKMNNRFNRDEEISATYITSGDSDDQSIYLGVNYPINYLGTKLTSTVGYSDSPVNNQQRVAFVTAGVSHPLFLDYYKTFEVNASVQRYHERQKQYSTNVIQKTNITKSILGLNYTYNGKYAFDFAYHQGLNSSAGNPSIEDFGSVKRFNKFTLGVDLTQPLKNDYDIIYKFDGQYSSNNLLSAEIFAAGVYQGGRGFTSSEILGDKGISNSLELSKLFVIENHPLITSHREYIYLDNSHTWNNVQNNYKAKSSMITSAGIGTEITVIDNINFNLEFSKPINKKVKGSMVKDKTLPSSRIFAGLDYIFNF